MKRRALLSLITTLPLVARIRPATHSKSSGRLSIDLNIYDRDSHVVAVFTLEGTTYGIRIRKEIINDLAKNTSQSPETILSRFLYTVTGGAITGGADVHIRYRSSLIPQYQYAHINFITEYVHTRDLNTIPPGATIIPIQHPIHTTPEIDGDALIVYSLGPAKLFSYIKAQIIAGPYNVILLI